MQNKKLKLPQHLQMDTVSPATRLLEKRRQMYDVQETFEQQKQEFKKKELRFKQRQRDLRNKDLEIQRLLIKFSKCLKESEAKKLRAQKRAEDEEKLIQQKEEEIRQKDEEYKDLQNKSQKLSNKVEKMRKFEQYLERVKEKNPDEYSDLAEILARHRTLEMSNNTLNDLQKKLEDELQELKDTSIAYEKEKTNEILHLDNRINELKLELGSLNEQRTKLQNQVEATTSNARNKSSELGQILMSIENLYKRCTEERPFLKHRIDDEYIGPPNFDDLEKKGIEAIHQLDAIQNYLEDFKAIEADLSEKK